MKGKETPTKYDPPLVEVVHVAVEQGFASTTESNGQDMNPSQGSW